VQRKREVKEIGGLDFLLTRNRNPARNSQQTAEQQSADDQARKEADEKAWADAEKTGTVAGYTC
jgi:hypothetical protein